MRKIFSILTSGSAAVALLTACFGSAQTPAPVLPDTVHGPVKHANNICGSPSARRGPIKRATNKYPPDLYVADNTLDQVDILRNGSYAELGYITNGINGVSDVFLDKNSNLYVANFAGGTVTEYAPSEPCIPSFTYSTNMGLPAAVTADAHNDVYEGDQESNAINEYYQDENSIVQSCYPGGKVFSVAVDAANDVFALISAPSSGASELIEYQGGLGSACSAGTLNVNGLPSYNLSGLAVDKNSNLVVGAGAAVDVVDPPYASVTRRIGSGFTCAYNVTLNAANKLAFVSDICNNTVTVVDYQTGANVSVLGTGNGLVGPMAAVDWANAVY